MHDRIQRYVIPATVILMSAVISVWCGGKLTSDESLWKDLIAAGDAGIVAAVITVGVANYGLGYVCHLLFCAFMFLNRKERFVDTDRLFKAFGIKTKTDGKFTNNQLDATMGEFHRRLHSCASDSLRDHYTRRNSAWFITKTCAIAAVMGVVVGTFYILKSPNLEISWIGLGVWSLLVLMFAIASWKVGTRWNTEFWEVAWNWIKTDVDERELSEEWLKANNFIRNNLSSSS